MMRRMTLGTGAVLIATLAVSAHAQDRLKAMPGDSNFIAMAPRYLNVMKSGSVLGGGGGRGGGRGGFGVPATPGVVWAADGKGVDYSWDGKRFHLDFAKKVPVEVAMDAAAVAPAAAGSSR